MRCWAILLTAVLCATAGADDPATLQRRGEQLAKDGQFAEAIDAFKAADAIEPTAERACLIALAYSRRNLYGQAELFFDLCHTRADHGVPTWVAGVERQFRDRLDGAGLAQVTIVVKHGRSPRIVVSAFSPDEAFEPRTVYLPKGRHTITVTSGGREPLERVITVDGGDPQRVVIELRDPATAPAPSHLGRNLMLVGLGVAAAGAIVHATWYRSELHELEASSSPPDPARYDAHADGYRSARYATVGLYGIGVGLVVTGLVLRATRHRDDAPALAVVPIQGGGLVSVAWSR